MARRTLRNLDERILKKAVAYGALRGVGRVSTKKIASDLKITEPTIYVHFGTKANLLYKAYCYAAEMTSGKEGLDEGASLIRDRLPAMVEAAAAYPEAASYIVDYRHYEGKRFDDRSPDPLLEDARALLAGYAGHEKAEDIPLAELLAETISTYGLMAAKGKLKADDGKAFGAFANFLESGTKAALEGI